MELVSAIMANSHYAIAKVQKVFGFTSGKGEKFGLGQEKSPNTLLYQGWMGFLFIYFSSFNTLNVSSDIFSNR
jgi:hypothetical protein